MAMAFVEFENVSKIYKTGEVEISALHGASFTVEQGEICVIVGASGAGKTTLLNILGGMDTLTSGHREARRAGHLPLQPPSAHGVSPPRRGLRVPVL